jgi:hypothetical protein
MGIDAERRFDRLVGAPGRAADWYADGMSVPLSARDYAVRQAIYDTFARGGVPTRVSVLQALGLDYGAVGASYAALAAAHAIVLDDDSGEVAMALPFSAAPTPFRVLAGDVAVWANCAWDAFGVAAALERDVSFVTACPHSGVPIAATVTRGVAAMDRDVVARVGVPAARWWDDVRFT